MSGTHVQPKGLFKRGKGYALRVSIPAEYIPVVGKKEIVRGLGTQDLGEALERRKEVLSEILGGIREGKSAASSRRIKQAKPSPLNGTTVRDMAHRWLVEADGIKATTKAEYRRFLKAFEDYSGNVEVSEIDRALALGFIEWLKVTHQTARGNRGHIKP